MYKLWRSVSSYFLVSVLVFSVLASISNLGQSWIPGAQGAIQLPLDDFASADRRIYYLTAERSESLEIAIRNAGGQLAHDGVEYLPSGIRLTPIGEVENQFVIHIDESIDVDETRMPITYGVNFYDPEDTNKTASVLFVIEANSTDHRPSAVVRFDSEGYSVGDEVTIVVKDPHLECTVPESSSDGTQEVTIGITLNGASISGAPSALEKDVNSNNEFRGNFNLPSMTTGTLRAEYSRLSSDCVYPPESDQTDTELVFPAEATVGSVKVSFNNRNYTRVEPAILTVSNALSTPESINLFATWTNGSHSAELIIPDALRIIRAGAPVTNSVNLEALLPDILFPDGDFRTGYVNLTATYGNDRIIDQDSVTIVPEQGLSFIIPEGRTSYLTNDTASIQLIYPEWNNDDLDFDEGDVTICAYNATSRELVNDGMAVIRFAETGRNTGIFVNSYHLSFIDEYFEIGILPVQDQELFRQGNLKVALNGTTILFAKVGISDSCLQNLPSTLVPSASSPEVLVTVERSEPSNPEAGFGQSVGAVAHNPPLYTVSQVSCSQYNYGPDTDGDSICDNWETTSGLKLYYPAGGSYWTLTYTNDPAPKPDHMDIFVELDYVNNLGISPCSDGRTTDGNDYKPTTTSVNDVEAAFRGAPVTNDDGVNGVELHIYIDDQVNPVGTCYGTVSVWGDSGSAFIFDNIKTDNFGRDSSEELLNDPKAKAKYQVFHYALSIPKQAQDSASSGVAEQLGNDFVVSLGASGIGWSNANMAGTIMHELGHNLGLYHGGPDVTVGTVQNDYNVNCKPNYPSVMSYIRQLTNSYSNTTLKYSDDYFDSDDNGPSGILVADPLIYRTDPDESAVLKLTSSSAMSKVELVWGIDPPSAPVTILSGDANAFDPDIPGDVARIWTGISWNGDTLLNDNNVPDGQNIINLGISGCTGTDTDNTISGADDWANLKYNFRSLNPDAFETGFGDPQYYPIEVNSSIVTDIRVRGIETEDFLIQKLEDISFKGNVTCSDTSFNSTSHIPPDFPEVGETIVVEIKDPNANRDPDAAEEKVIRVTSTTDQVGVEFVADETGTDTGIFTLEIETTAGSEISKLTVKNGDDVTIRYTDECAGYPPKGNTYTITITIGGFGYSIMNMTLPEKVKTEFHGKLVADPSLVKNDYVKHSVSNHTLVELIRSAGEEEYPNDDVTTAIQELLALRELMDASFGGNKSNDLFEENWETKRALGFLDNNIASLKEAINVPYDEIDPFVVVSYDFDCELSNDTFDGCRIYGYSESATTTADTFQVSPDNKRISWDFVGQEDVQLEIPKELAEEIYFVSSYQGGLYDFDTTDNATTLTLTINDLDFHPRKIGAFYDLDLVSASALEFIDSKNNVRTTVEKGEQLVIKTTLQNHGDWEQNYAAIFDIRDDNNISVFIEPRTGALGPEGAENSERTISMPWVAADQGTYTARLHIVSDFENPRLLSLSPVREGTFDAGGSSNEEVVISSDKRVYGIGENIQITIADPDANRDPALPESLTRILAFSDISRQGETVSALETADDTGIFTSTVLTSATAEPGQLTVRNGDTVRVEYTNGEGRQFWYTIIIEQDIEGSGRGIVNR